MPNVPVDISILPDSGFGKVVTISHFFSNLSSGAVQVMSFSWSIVTSTIALGQ